MTVAYHHLQQSPRYWAAGLAGLMLALLMMSAIEARAAELVMLEEDGCWWCAKWTQEVGVIYDKTPEGKLAPLRRLDIHERLPVDLRFLDKGGYTPTFILVENGKEYGRIRGYPGEDFFWGLLGQMLKRMANRQPKLTETSN